MLLTDLPDDQLRQIFDAGQVERTIATFVWKQVSQTTKRVVPEGAKTYRCAMRCSSKLRALARPMARLPPRARRDPRATAAAGYLRASARRHGSGR